MMHARLKRSRFRERFGKNEKIRILDEGSTCRNAYSGAVRSSKNQAHYTFSPIKESENGMRRGVLDENYDARVE